MTWPICLWLNQRDIQYSSHSENWQFHFSILSSCLSVISVVWISTSCLRFMPKCISHLNIQHLLSNQPESCWNFNLHHTHHNGASATAVQRRDKCLLTLFMTSMHNYCIFWGFFSGKLQKYLFYHLWQGCTCKGTTNRSNQTAEAINGHNTKNIVNCLMQWNLPLYCCQQYWVFHYYCFLPVSKVIVLQKLMFHAR